MMGMGDDDGDGGSALRGGLRAAPCPQLLLETVDSEIRSCPLCQLAFPIGYPEAHRFAPGEQQDLRLPPTHGLPPPRTLDAA